jgi:hypothetical protein
VVACPASPARPRPWPQGPPHPRPAWRQTAAEPVGLVNRCMGSVRAVGGTAQQPGRQQRRPQRTSQNCSKVITRAALVFTRVNARSTCIGLTAGECHVDQLHISGGSLWRHVVERRPIGRVPWQHPSLCCTRAVSALTDTLTDTHLAPIWTACAVRALVVHPAATDAVLLEQSSLARDARQTSQTRWCGGWPGLGPPLGGQ